LTEGTNDLTLDMGIYSDKLSTIGDTVWYDNNKDGIQDDTELGVNGVKVTLYNGANVEATTVTDARGAYIFRDVKNGTYTVGFSKLPSGYKVSPENNGTDDTLDSDVNIGTLKTGDVNVTTSSINLDVDMGIYSDALLITTLGDTVWYDDDKDGIQDATELGVNGVQVTLYKAGVALQTTITDNAGTYLFRDLVAGTYTVGFSDLPSGYKVSPKDATADSEDSDVNIDTNQTDNIILVAGDTNLDVDMGIYSNGFLISTIGDTVWYDDDKDGIQDSNELGASGVQVTLYDGVTIVKSMVTDSKGSYLFRDVISGTYIIGFSDLPSGYKISPQGGTVDTAKDSDANVANGKTGNIVVTAGSNTLDIDMGIYNDSDFISSLGDTVWFDDNKDGIQDSSELGVNGVTVTLYDTRGTVLKTTLTNKSGTYLFRDLIADTYVVGFTDLPSGYKISPKDVGLDNKDSDVNSTTGRTEQTLLAEKTNKLDVDMGIYSDKLSTIGDSVWFDDNQDGIQDATELGVSGVKVTLYTGATVVQRTVTNDKGSYIFRNLLNGDYIVEFSNLPSGYKISPKSASSNEKDSDADITTGKTDVIVVTTSSNNLDVDMGIYTDELSTLGDTVWYDDNKDGIQDKSESGVEGVKVTLYNGATIVQTVVTDRHGVYTFRDTVEGTYVVGFTDLPNAYRISAKATSTSDKDSNVNVATGKTDTIIVPKGSNNLTVDMGIYSNELSTLGDTVWYDDNQNGIQDEDEFGAEGIKVMLYSGTTVVQTAVTDLHGVYVFRAVREGTYTVEFSNLSNAYRISPQNVGDDKTDSDSDVKTGRSDTIVVTTGINNLDVDMGIYSELFSTIGDSVWYDNNKNGVQEEIESGVNGVRVTLYDTNEKVVQTTVTDEHGVYIFRAVRKGTYTVGFSNLPTGYKISPKNVGADETDSDIYVGTGKSDTIVVRTGMNNLDVDMGIYSDTLASIGNAVWYDDNRNGVQDSAEKGVEAVKVTLYTQSGVAIDMTTTDNSGVYHFYKIIPNTYYLVFSDIPVGYQITQKDVGDNQKDSDADILTGQTVLTQLSAGENDLSWDMGIFNKQRATIGDTVWYDDNKNGIQDDFERGVDAVKVTLYTDSNVEVDSTLTDNRGNYKFVNLLPAKYYLAFSDLPISYEVTLKDQGSDSKDSDVDPKTLRTEITNLIAGENDLSWDMGIYDNKGASIGDTVWYDDNANGIQDVYERDAEDVLVRLFTAGGTKVATTITDEKGNYSFRNLVPTSYYLEFANLPVGYEISPKDTGDDNKDSDVNPLDAKTAIIAVEIGQHAMNWDMGIFNKLKGTIGDMVWADSNHNGLQDMNETGINGIKITLFNAKKEVVKTKITSNTGQYLFRDLVAGDYFVEFSEFPLGYMITKKNVSDDFLQDSDANYHRGQTVMTTLDAGENDLSWDLGLYPPQLTTVGGIVWLDTNRDGIKDANENGIGGVEIILVKNDIKQLPSEQTTTATTSVLTDENGNYIFTNLEVGEPHHYHIIFNDTTLPTDFIFSVANQGENNNGSNINPDSEESENIILLIEPLVINAGVEGFVINDDTVNANTEGGVTNISVLSNDSGNIDSGTILFVNVTEGAILYNNNTAVGGANVNTSTTYVVEGEGVWQVEIDGTITFTAERGFTGVPSPVYYIVEGVSGGKSNVAKIEICTPCVAYKTSSSVATLNYGSMLVILFTISLLGVVFARREFESEV
jgi:protocatechuate 3,4-dioxygenase beta subunit